MFDHLHGALHCLQATGAAGFEGLIQAHISRLTGRRFFLAKSGTQAGKDTSTAGYSDTYIDIECKRYRRNMSATARDLAGGLEEAINAGRGRLDLWLVVSTGAVGSTEAEVLRQVADREVVAVEIIDWQETGLPQLAVLCAGFAEETLLELRMRGVSSGLGKIAADLKAVAGDPGFSDQLGDLRNRLSTADLGLDHARAVANGWLEARLATKAGAMSAFHQPLCVSDVNFQPYVERPAPQAALKAWYASWPNLIPLAAVLGREGNGKSWVTMAWWKALESKPLTLVITSNSATATDVLSLIASALLTQTDVRDLAFWERCVTRWLQRPHSGAPTVLLILDGLNERPRQAWDEVFASLVASDRERQIAVVTTCRPAFWSERIAPYLPDGLEVTLIDVQSFNDAELARAWGDRRPALNQMSKDMRDFIRTPRVFRLARDHVERLMQSGDLTVERLQIEDWADRRRSKLGLAHSVLDFNNLVIALARDIRQGLPEFERDKLRAYSSLARRSPDRDLDKDFDEIIDGQLFECVDPLADRYRVRPEHVGLALGMLLAQEARDAHRENSIAGVEHVLGEALDPVADLDQTSATLRGACAVACLEPSYPAGARRALLHAWVCRPNLDDSQWLDFAAYLPLAPDSYFDLAEDLWFDADCHPSGREWVAAAILRWRNQQAVRSLIAARCTRWLGIWRADWHPFAGRPDADRLEHQRQVIDKNWARLTDSERRLVNQLLSEVPTPHAPFTARLALLLISHGPRSVNMGGFVAWALSRAIMELPLEAKEIAWCLRLNEHDPTETDTALLSRVEVLLECASEVGIQAARWLLWASGTPRATARLAALPALPREEFPARRPLIEVDPLDPAALSPADLSPITGLLASFDRSEFWGSLYRTSQELQFDEIEPILARFAPYELSGFYRQLLRDAPEREDIRLRQLAWRVPEHLLLIGPNEARALDEGRRSLFPRLDSNLHDARATEAYLLLGVLGHHPIEEQLDLLLECPEAALDLITLEDILAVVPAEVANARLVRAAKEGGPPHALRRLLWVLSRNAFALSAAARDALIRCFGHRDPLVRAVAFRVARICKDKGALKAHVASVWCASFDDSTVESFYGSTALIEGADPVDYQLLRRRVAPELMGYLARRDGSPRAIEEFANDLDALWETMMRSPIPSAEMTTPLAVATELSDASIPEPDLASVRPLAETALRTVRVFGRRPSAEDLDRFFAPFDPAASTHALRDFGAQIQRLIMEARRAGHHFFGKGIRNRALREVAQHRPDLIEKWTQGLGNYGGLLWGTADFYRALCAALGPIDPNRAAIILAHLRAAAASIRVTYRPMNIDSLTSLAFQLSSSPRVDTERERLLEGAHTDELLFQIALAAQATRSTDWLARAIWRALGGPGVCRVARGLTLIGFLDEGPQLDGLRPQLDGRVGFLADVAKHARRRLEQNYRARAWFAQFLARRDRVEAWAAFRLFLRCLDRRFYLWRDAMCDATPDVPLPWRQQMSINDNELRQATESNEGRLCDVLFGLRISKGEIAPWYSSPPMAEISCPGASLKRADAGCELSDESR